MKRIILSIGLFLGVCSSVLAQDSEKISQKSLLKLGLLPPNFEYEHRITPNLSVVSEAGMSFTFGYGGRVIGTIFDYSLITRISPRYYYNLDNRLKDDKSIKNYSGNYVSLNSGAVLYNVFSNVEKANQYFIGPTWGLQRNLGKRWFFNAQIGPGLSINKVETEFSLLLGFDIGFVF